jgi:hypothetical protein
VTEKNDSPEGEFEDANNRLSEGLKSCRAVLSNYRALLESEGKDGAAGEDQSSDEPENPPPPSA